MYHPRLSIAKYQPVNMLVLPFLILPLASVNISRGRVSPMEETQSLP